MSQPKILCITHSGDHFTVDKVRDHLAGLGHEMIRFDSDRFGLDWMIDYRMEGTGPSLSWEGPDSCFSMNEIKGVWYRKLWSLSYPPGLAPFYRASFEREYKAYRDIFFHSLRSVPWINPIPADHEVGQNKLFQLGKAAEADLVVPKSLFTNDTAILRRFYKECEGNVVAKLHNSLSQTMDGKDAFVPTSLISESMLSEDAALRLCPMIFQQRIDKTYELRVVYVDGLLFTGRIQVPDHTISDWRAAPSLFWEPYFLPTSIAKKLQNMMQSMELPFGVIDMIRSLQGDYVFLEVNPQGEWGMLERDLHYPIARCIAETLVKQIEQ